MKFDKTEVWGFEHAIRGMRNPMNSWKYSDSYWGNDEGCLESYIIGEKDLELAQKLIKAGSEHRKFLRQIFISTDITAPLYWWKEFETYKVGVTANSTSTMHKLTSKPITVDCFEMGDFDSSVYVYNVDNEQVTTREFWKQHLIPYLEELRKQYNETKNKQYWKELVRLLPESWVQTRTVTMNYENVRTMIHQRTNHKLIEWAKDFIEWAKTLPYSEELLFFNQNASNESSHPLITISNFQN